MTISPYALVSLAELKDELGIEGPTTFDTKLEELILWGTRVVESQGLASRKVVTRGSNITEQHSPGPGYAELYLSEWPTITVVSVHESSARVYDATTLLQVNTDYLIDAEQGRLIRIAGASEGPTSWCAGFETVQVVHAAGVASTAAVDPVIKGVALRLLARMYQTRDHKLWGVSGKTDSTGAITRNVPPTLTAAEMDALSGFRRYEFSTTVSRVA